MNRVFHFLTTPEKSQFCYLVVEVGSSGPIPVTPLRYNLPYLRNCLLVRGGDCFNYGVEMSLERSVGLLKWEMVEKRELMTYAELYSLMEKGSLDIGEVYVVIPKRVFRGSTPGTSRLSLVAWCNSEGRYTIPIRVVEAAR